MSTKFKALALGLVAMLTIGALGVMNAGANPTDPHRGGHFVSNAPSNKTIIRGFEKHETTHDLAFTIDAGTAIDCNVTNYEGTASGATVEQVTVTPEYKECFTTNPEKTPVNVTTNGCGFEFTVNTAPATSHNAVHLEGCKTAEGIIVHHPNCTITIPPQTVTGVTYKNVRETGLKHEVTLNSTITTLTAHYHGGICVFLGTTHKGEMKGSATVRGFDSKTGEQVDITAT